MSSTTRIILGIVFAAGVGTAAVLALSAGDDSGDPTTTVGSTVAATGTSTPEDDGPDDTSPVTAPTLGDCSPEGTWLLRSDEFFATVSAISGAAGQFEHLSGQYLVTFGPGGAYTGTREAWSWRVTSAEGTIVIEISSENPGTWSVTGDTIDIVEEPGEAEASMWLDQGGTLVPLPVGTDTSLGAPGFTGQGTFECSGTVLTLHLDGDTGVVTSVFDRQG